MCQAEDRTHRISQKNAVNVFYLCGAGSIDETIIKMLEKKSHVISDALDGSQADYSFVEKNNLPNKRDEVINKIE